MKDYYNCKIILFSFSRWKYDWNKNILIRNKKKIIKNKLKFAEIVKNIYIFKFCLQLKEIIKICFKILNFSFNCIFIFSFVIYLKVKFLLNKFKKF